MHGEAKLTNTAENTYAWADPQHQEMAPATTELASTDFSLKSMHRLCMDNERCANKNRLNKLLLARCSESCDTNVIPT
jgi:hypothetical protein